MRAGMPLRLVQKGERCHLPDFAREASSERVVICFAVSRGAQQKKMGELARAGRVMEQGAAGQWVATATLTDI